MRLWGPVGQGLPVDRHTRDTETERCGGDSRTVEDSLTAESDVFCFSSTHLPGKVKTDLESCLIQEGAQRLIRVTKCTKG